MGIVDQAPKYGCLTDSDNALLFYSLFRAHDFITVLFIHHSLSRIFITVLFYFSVPYQQQLYFTLGWIFLPQFFF